jgi:hypothetical protein
MLVRANSISVVLAGSTLMLAACGGSGSNGSKSSGPGAGIRGPVRIYKLTLSGAAETQRGARAGKGVAIIAFHGASEVCWRFAHLHGFTDATSARIHSGAKGKAGRVVVSLSGGPRLRHQGCRHVSASVITAIERSPQDYYVNVHSARYPHGAVRAQL